MCLSILQKKNNVNTNDNVQHLLTARQMFWIRGFLLTFQSSDLDYFSVNLRIEPALIKENFNLRWVSEAGVVENINAVVEEYKKLRHLLVSGFLVKLI